MKSDDIWWNLMKSDENLCFHQISSDFISFHFFDIFWYFSQSKIFLIFFGNNIWAFCQGNVLLITSETTWKLNAFCQGNMCFQNWNMLCFPRSQTNVHLNSLWWFPKMFWWQMGPLAQFFLLQSCQHPWTFCQGFPLQCHSLLGLNKHCGPHQYVYICMFMYV